MMTENVENATRHDPNRPAEGEAVVYGLVTVHAPEHVVYVGATTQHPAAWLLMARRHPVPRSEIRYVILWAGAREGMAAAEREWIERLHPVWNHIGGGGGGRGHSIDTDEAVRLYREGRSLREIAVILGCHHSAVGRAIPAYMRRSVGSGR